MRTSKITRDEALKLLEKYNKEPFHIQVPRDIYLDAQNILKDELIKIGHSKMTFSSEEFLESNEELNTLFDFEK